MMFRSCAILVKRTISLRSFSSYPAHSLVGMPALSPTMTSGTIASWNKKVGEEVKAGDSFGDIETDKASMAFEAQDDAIIAKILVEPGKEVPVGTPILITVEDVDSVAAFKDYVVDAAPSTAAVPPVVVPVAAPVAVPPTAPKIAVQVTPAPVVSSPAPVQVAAPAVPAAVYPAVTSTSSTSEASTALLSFIWGTGVSKSAIYSRLSSEQQAYILKYGGSSHKAL